MVKIISFLAVTITSRMLFYFRDRLKFSGGVTLFFSYLISRNKDGNATVVSFPNKGQNVLGPILDQVEELLGESTAPFLLIVSGNQDKRIILVRVPGPTQSLDKDIWWYRGHSLRDK